MKLKFSGDAVLRIPVNNNRLKKAMSPALSKRIKSFLKHVMAILCLCVLVAQSASASDQETGVRETAALGEAVEMHMPEEQPLTPWIHDPAIFEKDEGDRTEMREVVEPDIKTIKLNNLVPPIHFGLGEAVITENYLDMLRHVLNRMRDRDNVRLHFIGHADSLPLRGELIELYIDNIGLSRERAGTVAEYCQRALESSPRIYLLRRAWRQSAGG